MSNSRSGASADSKTPPIPRPPAFIMHAMMCDFFPPFPFDLEPADQANVFKAQVTFMRTYFQASLDYFKDIEGIINKYIH